MAITWSERHHSELTATEVYDVLALRSAVFVVEQDCAYLDPDGLDLSHGARHLLGHEDGELRAYARLLDGPGATVRIGRVVVASAARGQGLATELMHRALLVCAAHWPARPVVLSAQSHLVDFYGRLGFVAGPPEEEYLEDGIPHRDMRLDPRISQ